MPRNGKRSGGPTGSPRPAAKRPSNPRALAKAIERPPPSLVAAAELAASGPSRGRRRTDSAAQLAALPASVLMEAAETLHGEAPRDGASPRHGVVYRLTIRDIEGRPITERRDSIRKHLLPAPGAPGAAQITAVSLDERASADDFVGVDGPAAETTDARLDLLEYFSFEVRGMTFVIPRSGYRLRVVQRGAHLQVTRTPHEIDTIHGAVAPGLIAERASDTYACRVG